MGRRTRATAATVIVALGSLIGSAPASAVTASFDATCVTTGGIHGPMTAHRTFTATADAPDSVAPGATFSVETDVGYTVPENAALGGAFYDVVGASPASSAVSATPGAASIHGSYLLTASGAIGGTVAIQLHQFGAMAYVGSLTIVELCTPDHPLVVARVGIGVPQLSIGDAAVVEGSSGTRALQFAVTLSRPAATDVSVAFATEDGTATAGTDYGAQSGTVTVPAGFVSRSATVTLRVRGDRTIEPKENLRVRLHDPVGAVLGRAVGTGRIIDDDPESGPRISIGDASVVEGARAVRSMRFVVSLSEPALQQIQFHYRTVDGSAVGGVDFEVQDSQFSIPAGMSSITVPVPVIPDAAAEPNESLTVQLVGATGAVIGRARGVGTILDDD